MSTGNGPWFVKPAPTKRPGLASVYFTLLTALVCVVIWFVSAFPTPYTYFMTKRNLGGLQPAPSAGPAVPSELGTILKYSGDQVVTLPNGAYTTAAIDYLASSRGTSTPNSGGNGTYGGWLIIAAQNKWGATVDLTNNGFNLGPMGGTNQAYRVLFVGIAFSNGDIALWESHFLRFWYCSFTFPGSAYQAQYIAAGGNFSVYDATVIDKMKNPNCRGIGFVNSTLTSPYNSFLGCYGCTFKTIANDALYCQPAQFVDAQGNYFIDIFHHTVSPPNPNPALGFLFHSDSWQVEWGSCSVFAQNTVANGDLQIECNDSGIHQMAITDNWFGGSPNVMATLDEFRQGAGSFSGNVVRNNRLWSGGQYQNGSNQYTANPSYDSGYDAGPWFHATTGLFELPSGWTDAGSNTFTTGGGSAPTGVTVTAGLITDLPNNPSEIGNTNNGGDPALNWQNANSYSSWSTYFTGRNRTVTDATYTSGSSTIQSATLAAAAGDEGLRVQALGIPGDCYAHFVDSTHITLKDHSGAAVNCNGSSSGSVGDPSRFLVVGSGGWN